METLLILKHTETETERIEQNEMKTQSIQELLDNIIWANLPITGIQGWGKQGEKKQKEYLKK